MLLVVFVYNDVVDDSDGATPIVIVEVVVGPDVAALVDCTVVVVLLVVSFCS